MQWPSMENNSQKDHIGKALAQRGRPYRSQVGNSQKVLHLPFEYNSKIGKNIHDMKNLYLPA